MSANFFRNFPRQRLVQRKYSACNLKCRYYVFYFLGQILIYVQCNLTRSHSAQFIRHINKPPELFSNHFRTKLGLSFNLSPVLFQHEIKQKVCGIPLSKKKITLESGSVRLWKGLCGRIKQIMTDMGILIYK